jgi:drug/metabolite transporter (DMT)-like permease
MSLSSKRSPDKIIEAETEPTIKPAVGLIIGVIAVSTASIFIRFVQPEIPPLVIAAYRLSLATIILFPIVIIRYLNELLSIGWKKLVLALVSGLFLAVHFASWITSLRLTTVASSVVFVTTTPLWVGLFSSLFLKEHLTKPFVMGLLFSITGGVIIGINDSCTFASGYLSCPPIESLLRGKEFMGNLLALFGAIMAAGYLMTGKKLREDISIFVYTFIVYGIAAIILLISVSVFHLRLTGYRNSTYLWLLAIAIIPQLLGHSSFNWAVRYLSAGYVSIALLGEPVGSTILAFIVLNEIPSGVKIIGASFILIGIGIVSIYENRQKR